MQNQSKGIVLVGYTSSGKTSTGRYLSQRLCLPFLDVDEAVISRVGMHQDLFITKYGWDAFREAEYEVLVAAVTAPGIIISTGGGTLLYEKSRTLLEKHGTRIYLSLSFEKLYERLQKRLDRPLLRGLSREEAEEMFQKRLPFYEMSNMEIDVNCTIDVLVERVNKVAQDLFPDTPFEFWFRKEIEQEICNKTLKCFVRPGIRMAPAAKGASVGTHARMRILETPGTELQFPTLSSYVSDVRVVNLRVKKISECNSMDFVTASVRANSIDSLLQQLQSTYQRPFQLEDVVTFFEIEYL